MKIFILLVSFFVSVFGQVCDDDETLVGDRCYWFSDNLDGFFNFWDARFECQEKGGDLAVFNTMEQLAALRDLHLAGDHWIGGTDERHQNGTYGWVDGSFWNSSVADEAWGTGQPDNSGGTQHCAAWWRRGQEIGYWDDKRCDEDLVGYHCMFPTRVNCTCGPGESKTCDRGRGCRDYRLCESGQIITVQCPPGQLVNDNFQCVDENTLGPPCKRAVPSCVGRQGSFAVADDMCRSFYTCQGDSLTAFAQCPYTGRGLEETFDESQQECVPAFENCPPCGRDLIRPDDAPPCPTTAPPTTTTAPTF